MLFNFYAETSFTEMYGHGSFGVYRNTVYVHSCPTTCTWTIDTQSYQQKCQLCTLFCCGLKKLQRKRN